MPDWTKVLRGQKLAQELRAEKISSHSTVLRAMGGLGADVVKEPDWKDRIAGLEAIDWSKKNPDWQAKLLDSFVQENWLLIISQLFDSSVIHQQFHSLTNLVRG